MIILDVVMPNLNGWEVLLALKSDPYLADIPVIMLTVLEEKDRALALGAVDYLLKPIDRRCLIDLLQKYHPASFDPSMAAKHEPAYGGG